MSLALYRKYRSKSLAEVVGQDHITDILTRALKAERIAHAYLFTGPRGVGKTSIARILAHEINQLPYSETTQHLDIIEIDAASNNGVEDVRDLREKAQIAPVSARKKIYIIDEVHMLSKPAFNALLKTLEEPPEHVVFILATTDADKLPATIISRTQRFGFRAIHPEAAVQHLKFIANKEKIKISDDALVLIAERGDGSFRDSISLLDQLASLADAKSEISVELIETSLGLAPTKIIDDLIQAVSAHDVAKVAQTLAAVEADGINPLTLMNQLAKKLCQQAVEKPQLLPLLDALLDVSKSTHPYMKLLSVLGSAAHDHRPKSAALATPVLEVTATVKELKEMQEPSTPAKAPVSVQPKKQPTAEEPEIQALAEQATKKHPSIQSEKVAQVSTADFQWDTFVEHTRQNYVAVYSVLSKCDYELNDTELTIFAVNAFYKKKLDDPKYSVHLYDSLVAIGCSALTIHTVPTRAPMKSSQAAAVADIMGGGIEVIPEAA